MNSDEILLIKAGLSNVGMVKIKFKTGSPDGYVRMNELKVYGEVSESYQSILDSYSWSLKEGLLSDYSEIINKKSQPGYMDYDEKIFNIMKKSVKPPYVKSVKLLDMNDGSIVKLKYTWTNDFNNGSIYLKMDAGNPSLQNFISTGGKYRIKFQVEFDRPVSGGPCVSLYGQDIEFNGFNSTNFGNSSINYNSMITCNKGNSKMYQAGVLVMSGNRGEFEFNPADSAVQNQKIYGFSIIQNSGSSLGNSEIIDQNPGTIAFLNPVGLNYSAYLNHEKNELVYMLYYDRRNPVLNSLKLTMTGETKPRLEYSFSNGNSIVRDLCAGSYKLEVAVNDDGHLPSENVYVYLVKDSQADSVNTALKTYIQLFGSLNDDMLLSKKALFEQLIGNIDTSGCQKLVDGGKIGNQHVSWNCGTGGILNIFNPFNMNKYILTFTNKPYVVLDINKNMISSDGKFRVLFLAVDNTGNKLSANVSSGGVIITKKIPEFIALAQQAGQTIDPTNCLNDGCFAKHT